MNRISSQIGNDMNNPHKRDLSSGSHYSASSLPLPEYLSSSKNLHSVENYSRQPRNSATRSNASISFNPGLLSNSSNLNILTSAPKSSSSAYLVSGYNPSNQFTYSRTYEAGWNHSSSQTASHSTESARGNASSHRGNYMPIVIHSGTSSTSKPGNSGPLSTYTPLVPTHSFTQSQKWTPGQLQNPSPIRPSPQVVSGVHRPQTNNPATNPENQITSQHGNQNPTSSAVSTHNSTYNSHTQTNQASPPKSSPASAGNLTHTPSSANQQHQITTHPSLPQQQPQTQQTTQQHSQQQYQQQQHTQQVDWQTHNRHLQDQLTEKDRQLTQQQREIDALRAENTELRLRVAASVGSAQQGLKADPNHTLRSSHGSSQDSDPHKFLELFAQLNDEKKRLDTLTAKIMHAAPAGIAGGDGSVTRMSGEFLKDSFVGHKPAPESEGLSARITPAADGIDNFSFKKKTSISDLKQTLSSNFPAIESDKISWYRQMKKQKESVLEPSQGVSASNATQGSSQSRIKNFAVDTGMDEPLATEGKPKKAISKHKAPVATKKVSSKKADKQKETQAADQDKPEKHLPDMMDGRSPRTSNHASISESGESTITKILAQYRTNPPA